MKNTIKYFYNLNIEDFKKYNDIFIFKIDNEVYTFIPYFGNEQKLYDIYYFCRNNNIYCHDMLLNKDNSILTIFDNKTYILIKKNKCIDKELDLNDILNYSFNINYEHEIEWKKLWENKIDYYEYQMSQVAFKYPILKNSFNYYVGLTEMAISLLNYINNDVRCGICHSRIKYKEKLDEFLNPIDFLIDARVRDIAECIKINYIYNDLSKESIYNFLDNYMFTNSEAILLMSRLLYPSYYFDIYDLIIQDIIDEVKINEIIKKNVQYETFLKEIYLILKNKYSMIDIEWLN